jgi:hypothetical protein
MHAIVHKQANGGVTISHPSPACMELLTGQGMGMSPDKVARQIENFMIPPDGDRSQTFTREFATEWVNAVSSGGLTETQAYDLLTRRTQLRRGFTESATVDEADLPYHVTGSADHSIDEPGACARADCQDRYFRDALVWDDTQPNKCRCDMPTARGIHLEMIRGARNAELAALDTPFMRAVEAGDTDAQAAIAKQKQTLRDIPQTFDLTTSVRTPAQLKALWPDGLERGA